MLFQSSLKYDAEHACAGLLDPGTGAVSTTPFQFDLHSRFSI